MQIKAFLRKVFPVRTSTFNAFKDEANASLRAIVKDQQSWGRVLQESAGDIVHIKNIVNQQNSKRVLNVSSLGRRHYIEHLDYRVVDHCNLNCAYCNAYSPVAEKRFADPAAFERDLKRLHGIIGDKILRLHLLGGEPLLHPDIESFVSIARSVFQEADITITSNGLLVYKMPESLWTTMHNNEVDFYYTPYPVNFDYVEMKEFLIGKGVNAYTYAGEKKDEFLVVPLNPRGIEHTTQTYTKCTLIDCVQLRDGRLFHCPTTGRFDSLERNLSALALNGRFRMTSLDYIDLDIVESEDQIFDFLSRPTPFCRYCRTGNSKWVPWAKYSGSLSEWVELD